MSDAKYHTPRLNELAELKDGWDSYHGLAPTEAALRAADSLGWAALNNGGVTLVGMINGAEITIGITPDGGLESVTFFPARP